MSAASLPLPLLQRAHGVPNWVDLHTTQPERACDFYEQILGWTLRRPPLSAVADRPASSPLPAIDETPSRSSLALVDGEGVAEVVGRGAGDELSLLPSSWFPYVAVDDLDAALDLVEPAGGLVLSSAATRDDGARVATILDQADAVLRLWEPAKLIGAPVVGQPGSLSWIELETNDLDGARKFYGELFDWDSGEVDDPGCGQPYLQFTCAGDPVAGAVWSPLSDLPASWCTAFAVTDTDEATRAAVDAGGVIMTEPVETARGRHSVLVDPTGAVFGLLGPAASGPRPL